LGVERAAAILGVRPPAALVERARADGLRGKKDASDRRFGPADNVYVVRNGAPDGHTMLITNLHSGLFLPGTWFELGMSSPDYHVVGATIPGIPSFLV